MEKASKELEALIDESVAISRNRAGGPLPHPEKIWGVKILGEEKLGLQRIPTLPAGGKTCALFRCRRCAAIFSVRH
jgi:hypothetical protein